MVHLAMIPNDDHIKQDDKSTLTKGMEKLQLGSSAADYSFTTSVYGSKFAAEDLPKHVMPEESMPKEVAYRMIKDDLSLDGNPMLK
jgi:glutamate decarboxylase